MKESLRSKIWALKLLRLLVEEEKDIHEYKKFNKADMMLFDTPSMEKSSEFQEINHDSHG